MILLTYLIIFDIMTEVINDVNNIHSIQQMLCSYYLWATLLDPAEIFTFMVKYVM